MQGDRIVPAPWREPVADQAAPEPPNLALLLERELAMEEGSLARLLRSLEERHGRDHRIAWTVPQVAEALGIATSTVYAYVDSGALPSFKLQGRLLVPCAPVLEMAERAVAQWRARQTTKADDPHAA
jgi:predicted DNA-binding transcriptional regulator AlpA